MLARETMSAIDECAVTDLRRSSLEVVDHIARQHNVVPAVTRDDPVGQFIEFAARPFAAGLPQITVLCSGRRYGARPEFELLRYGIDRFVNLGRMRSEHLPPELNTVLGIERIESQGRHRKREFVPRFGDGDYKSIEPGQALLEYASSFCLIDIDEQRKLAKRRFPGKDGQKIG